MTSNTLSPQGNTSSSNEESPATPKPRGITWLRRGAPVNTFILWLMVTCTLIQFSDSSESLKTGLASSENAEGTESTGLPRAGGLVETSGTMTPTGRRPEQRLILMLVCTRAYSVYDEIDEDHRNARSPELRYLTSSGTDASQLLHGAAGPKELQGARLLFPFLGTDVSLEYLDHYRGVTSILVDDTGGLLRRRNRDRRALFGPLDPIHMELRFPTSHEARQFGVRTFWIYLDTRDTKSTVLTQPQGNKN